MLREQSDICVKWLAGRSKDILSMAKAATIVAAFAYVMPSGTVLTPMGDGTGSWRHNRVAGAGIEPASGGYEPPEVPLLYPAMF